MFFIWPLPDHFDAFNEWECYECPAHTIISRDWEIVETLFGWMPISRPQ